MLHEVQRTLFRLLWKTHILHQIGSLFHGGLDERLLVLNITEQLLLGGGRDQYDDLGTGHTVCIQ